MSQNVSFKRALTEFSFVIVDLYTSDLLSAANFWRFIIVKYIPILICRNYAEFACYCARKVDFETLCPFETQCT